MGNNIVEVITSRKLDEDTLIKIEEIFNYECVVMHKIDESIINGIIIQHNFSIDEITERKIKNLTNELSNR